MEKVNFNFHINYFLISLLILVKITVRVHLNII